jgi:tetratricopeptide (TPR) repeat protein
MAIVQSLSLLALRQTVVGARSDAAAGKDADSLMALLFQRFAAVGPRLTAALRKSADHAWKILEIALGGPAWWERGQSLLNTPEDQSLRDDLRTFLDSPFVAELGAANSFFRQECGRELRAARSAGLLDDFIDEQNLLRQAVAAWYNAVDMMQLLEAERRVVEPLVARLRTGGQAHLSRLVEMKAHSGNSILSAAVRVAFRRAVEQDEQLRQNFPWATAETVPELHGQSLGSIASALERNGARLGDLFQQQGAGLDTRNDGLDLGIEQKQLGPVLQPLARDVMALLGAVNLHQRALGVVDLLAVPDEEERRRIQQLAARFRNASEEQRRQAPALLNGLAKLEALAGDFEQALRDFQLVAALTSDPRAQAEAHANTYQVALERRAWPDALAALTRAAALDADRFAPFPLAKYEPESIQRVDTFGVAFLCRHRTSAVTVKVRTLWPEVLARGVAEIFHEAQVLESLEQPANVRLRDCDFADPAQTRPYLVHDHFEGPTLAGYVEQHGPIAPGELVQIVRPLVEALQAAHAKSILHRDLNPTNVVVRKDAAGWRVKLLNFGLALKGDVLRAALLNPAARSHTILGRGAARALDYGTPEQLGRLPETPLRSYTDIYSFGKTCYYALLRTPEPDDEEKETLPAGWRKLLGHCTSVSVARRPASFEPILQRLAQAAGEVPSSVAIATPPTPAAPPQPVRAAAEAPRAETEEALACIQRGVALRTKGQFDQALVEFNRAIRLDPKNPLAFEGRGNTYVNKGDFDQAIADYNHALKLDPKQALVYVNRGLAFVKKKESERAIADYTTAIQLDAKLPLAYLNRGSAYARHGDYDRAIVDYNSAVRLDDQLVLAYFNRGLANAKKGQFEQAISDYAQVLRLDPKNAPARERLKETEAARLQAQKQQPKPAPVPAAATAGRPAAPAASGVAAPAAPVKPRRPPLSEHGFGRQVRLLEGHTEPVRAVVFTQDGRRLLSAGEDKAIRLWDIKTAKTVVRYPGHTGGVNALAIAPNGERFLSGSQDHTLRLWDIDSGQEIRRFGASRFFGGGNAHGDAVVSIAYAPDGLRAISASWDKTLRLWDVESGKELRVYEGHQWLIHAVVFSPDGKHFLYGSEDQTTRLCEVETGQEVRRFEGHTSWVLGVAMSFDSRHVLTGSADGTVRLWNVPRGRELRRFGAQMGLVQSVALSPDSKQALTGEYSPAKQQTGLYLWNVETGAEVARLPGHQQLIWTLAFSPDGRYAASGSADTTVRVWRVG